ncbi:MAG: HNH endonuclease [Spirochaetia bacterium]|nr:HNH endonuclease [Spirochaetia bacterium]
MKCYTCGKELKKPPSALKSEKCFCNHKCYSEYKRNMWLKENNPRYNGGEQEFICKYCGKKFTSKPYGDKRIPKYCSISCAAKYRGKEHRGNNHWNYKDGAGRTTLPIRRLGRYEKWRCDILKRDNYKCTNCGSEENLQVHHIKELYLIIQEYKDKHNELNVDEDIFYNVDNGITLCRKCHIKLHKQQKKNG